MTASAVDVNSAFPKPQPPRTSASWLIGLTRAFTGANSPASPESVAIAATSPSPARITRLLPTRALSTPETSMANDITIR